LLVVVDQVDMYLEIQIKMEFLQQLVVVEVALLTRWYAYNKGTGGTGSNVTVGAKTYTVLVAVTEAAM
jgi:hypothetical protein